MKFLMCILSILYIWINNMFKRIISLFYESQSEINSSSYTSNCNIHNNMKSLKISGAFNLSLLESLNWLHLKSPCFPVHAKHIQIINDPNTFYKTLLVKCVQAKYRIVLSSLYIGTGKLENQLVTEIHKNLITNRNLKVKILLDYTRGTRGKINSKSLLLPLIKDSENFSLSLYHTPALRGLRKKFAPPKWNELIGLQHMKLYLFDDTVIISGANLSNDYFTNRQDRYIMIKDKTLCDFYSNLIDKVSEFSLQVKQNDKIELHSKWTLIPDKCRKIDFINQAKENIVKFFYDICEEQQKRTLENSKDVDTWVFPLVEMGQLDIHHDSIITKELLSSSLKNSKLKLASGYFNLTKDYMETITHNCLAKCSILMAHPNANGFLGASFPAGGIPAAYSLIAKQFYLNLLKANQHNRVNLFEYERSGWTYHAKGLWYYLPNNNLPTLTLIGSSNFGERSVNRDLETQICVVTINKMLQQEMQNEYDYLNKYGKEAEQVLLNRPIPNWVKAVVSLFRNFF